MNKDIEYTGFPIDKVLPGVRFKRIKDLSWNNGLEEINPYLDHWVILV